MPHPDLVSESGRPLDAGSVDECAEAVLAEVSAADDVHATGAHRAALAAALVRRLLPGLEP